MKIRYRMTREPNTIAAFFSTQSAAVDGHNAAVMFCREMGEGWSVEFDATKETADSGEIVITMPDVIDVPRASAAWNEWQSKLGVSAEALGAERPH